MNATTTQSSPRIHRAVGVHRRTARTAAWAAAALMLVVAVVGAIGTTESLNDHSRGLGAVSEIAMGLAFLAGAASLASVVPVTRWRRVLWMLGPVGLAVAGLSMLAVPVAGGEPPFWLFLLGAGLALIGTIVVGIAGILWRIWPWWTGIAVILLLPIMFGAPFSGILLAGVWACVALTVREPRPSSAATRHY